MKQEPDLAEVAEQALEELGDEVEQQFSEGYKGLSRLVMPLAVLCAKTGITANMVTAFRLVFVFPLWYQLNNDMHFWAIVTYGFGMGLDFFDGRVAQAMEDIGIVRTQEDRDNGAFFDSIGDKLYWVLATVIITFFANLDTYISNDNYYTATVLFVVALTMGEFLLGYVRIVDYLAAKEGEKRKLKSGMSGKLKMLLEGFGTGALYAYVIHLQDYNWVIDNISHHMVIKINTSFLYLGMGMLGLALPFLWRSYRLKRPKAKK